MASASIADPVAQPDLITQGYQYAYTFITETVSSLYISIADEPSMSAFRILATFLILTRIATTVSARVQENTSDDTPQPVSILPYWLPWAGHWLAFAFHGQLWMRNTSLQIGKGVIGLFLLGRKVNVVVTSELISQVLREASEGSKVTQEGFAERRRRRFFAYRTQHTETNAYINAALKGYRDDKQRLVRISRLLEQHVPNLVSGTTSLVDQEQWERRAAVQPSEQDSSTCHANLQILVRDFTSHILLTALLGSAFVQNNPDFPVYFAQFSRSYARFMVGLPYWIVPSLGPPAGARMKCLTALQELVREMRGADANKAGLNATFDDLSDVDRAVWTLIEQTSKEEISERDVACMLLELVHDTLWYSTNITFWTLLYLHLPQQKSLLSLCRKDTQRLVTATMPKSIGLGFSEPPRLKFHEKVVQTLKVSNATSLDSNKDSLRMAVLETIRHETEFEDWLAVAQPLVLEEEFEILEQPDTETQSKLSEKNTTRASRTIAALETKKYLLRPGEQVYLAHGSTKADEEIWGAGAEQFDPTKFMTGKKTAASTDFAVKRWQDAMSNLIELARSKVGVEEVILIVVAVLSLWEVTAVAEGGELVYKGSTIVNGVGLTKKNVRVAVVRRKLEEE